MNAYTPIDNTDLLVKLLTGSTSFQLVCGLFSILIILLVTLIYILYKKQHPFEPHWIDTLEKHLDDREKRLSENVLVMQDSPSSESRKKKSSCFLDVFSLDIFLAPRNKNFANCPNLFYGRSLRWQNNCLGFLRTATKPTRNKNVRSSRSCYSVESRRSND